MSQLSVVLVEAITAEAKPAAKSDGTPPVEKTTDSGATVPVHKSTVQCPDTMPASLGSPVDGSLHGCKGSGR